MKKIFYSNVVVILFAILIAVSSCNKDPLIVTSDLSESPVSLAANPYNTYQTFTFNVNHQGVLDALAAAKVSDLTRVKKVGLKQMKALISTTGVNFDKISGVWVNIKLPGTSGDGDQIAYIDNFANGATDGILTIQGTDIKQLLTSDMILTVKVLSKPGGSNAFDFKLTEGIIEVEVKT